jgi:hypothetical protein
MLLSTACGIIHLRICPEERGLTGSCVAARGNGKRVQPPRLKLPFISQVSRCLSLITERRVPRCVTRFVAEFSSFVEEKTPQGTKVVKNPARSTNVNFKPTQVVQCYP